MSCTNGIQKINFQQGVSFENRMGKHKTEKANISS